MRLLILTDLHLEFAPFRVPDCHPDVVILAGDIHVGRNALPWIRQHFPSKPVLYVLGNHEFYHHNLPNLTQELQSEAEGSSIHVLENQRFDWEQVTFLGATLWTDFALYGDFRKSSLLAREGMNDFRLIHTVPDNVPLHPDHVRQLHANSVQWLREESARAVLRKLVIITHHAPSVRSIGQPYRGNPLNPAFASNLDALVEASHARLWVHGHIHSHVDYPIGQTRVLANPRGYPDENTGAFDPALVVEI